MARAKSPFFSLGASKQIGKALIFKQKGSRSFVTRYNKPGGSNPSPASAKQLNIRMLCNLIIARWLTMTPNERKVYTDLVKNKNLEMSGWNYFYKEAIKDLPTYLGLQGYWSFNEIINGEVLDISGNNNDGALGPAYPNNAPILENSINERFGKAVYFDGVDDYINCGNNSNINIFGSDEWTIEWWMKIKGTGDASQDTFNGLDHIPRIFIELANKNIILAGKIGGIYNVLVGTPNNVYEFNVWTHFAVQADTTQYRIFINGVEAGANAYAAMDTPFNNFYIGKPNWGGESFRGWIDETIIYNRALSASELLKHYKIKT